MARAGAFSRTGAHAWDEPEASSYWDYRLWATTRTGQGELWGEASWHETGAIRFRAPYPNPFHASCAVTLSASASAGRLELRIYDAAGRAIRRIFGASGQITLRWDGQDDQGQFVPAGVYWIEARVGLLRRSARVVRLP